MVDLLFHDSSSFVDCMLSSNPELLSSFTSETGYVMERHFLDSSTFNVSRIAVPFEIICFKSYLGVCILMSYVSYLGIWQIFKAATTRFANVKLLFVCTLCIPSVVFWSGGISKEVIIMFGLGALCGAINGIIHTKGRRARYVFYAFSALYLLMIVKPYIIVALFPAVVLWFMTGSLIKIKSAIVRLISFPIIVIAAISLSVALWQTASSFLGEYGSIDLILDKALVSQQDLQHERYEGNSFDIGDYEPTLIGVLSKFPQASFAGLYRPLLFEANNIVMLLSGIETMVFLILTLYGVSRFRKVVGFIGRNEILVFALVFTIVFGFAIGLSTSNFGALVRFRIPFLPFFALLVAVPFLLERDQKPQIQNR